MQTTYAVGEYRTGEGAFTCQGHPGPALTARRAALFVHGAAATAASSNAPPTSAILLALADAGYPVHVGDYCASAYRDSAGGGYNWGNSDHVAAVAAGVTFIQGLPGVKTDKVCLYAGSMGAAGAMNYYKANPTKVAAIGLTIPLLNLNDLSSNDKGFIGASTGSAVAASMYALTLPQATITLNESFATSGLTTSGLYGPGGGANKVNVLTSNGWQLVAFTGTGGTTNSPTLTGCTGGTGTLSAASTVSQGFGATLTNAYGVTWPALLSGTQLSASSPIVWSETAGGLTVPVKVWSSDNDPVACTTAACQTWAAAVGAAGGGNVTPVVESIGAAGHGGTVPPAEIVQWFAAHGGLS